MRGAGQPVARAGQPVRVFHVLADVGARRADRRRVRRAAALRGRHQRLQHALAHQMPRHLAFGLRQEPVGKPADFGAIHRVLGEQPALALQDAARLVEIFGDDGGADDRHVALGKQHRQRRRGVERQELLAPRPGLLLDQHQFLAVFAEGEADETAGGEHRVMEKRQHGPAAFRRWPSRGRAAMTWRARRSGQSKGPTYRDRSTS